MHCICSCSAEMVYWQRARKGGKRKPKPCILSGCCHQTGDVRRHLVQFHKMSPKQAKECYQNSKAVGCRLVFWENVCS